MNIDVKKNEVKEAAMMFSRRRDESWKSLQKVPFAESTIDSLRAKKQARNLSIYNNLTK